MTDRWRKILASMIAASQPHAPAPAWDDAASFAPGHRDRSCRWSNSTAPRPRCALLSRGTVCREEQENRPDSGSLMSVGPHLHAGWSYTPSLRVRFACETCEARCNRKQRQSLAIIVRSAGNDRTLLAGKSVVEPIRSSSIVQHACSPIALKQHSIPHAPRRRRALL